MSDARPSGGSALLPGLPEHIAERAPEVVVVGDAVLDEWLEGPSGRLSREAPVPVVDIARRRLDPGGAAHTAACLAALGARVRLVSAVGDDDEGVALRALLDAAGVATAGMVVEPGLRTSTKRRVLADGVLVARFDTTDRAYPRGPAIRDAVAVADVTTADAVVVCDHGHGTAVAAAAGLASRRAGIGRLVVDAHDLGRWAELAPDLVTPNRGEAEALLGRSLAVADPAGEPDLAAALDAATGELRAATGAATLAVTLDRDGAVLVPGSGPVHRTWATPVDELRACGAGDAFTAALTLALVCEVPERTAVELAQAAADVAVGSSQEQGGGTAAATTADLVTALARARSGPLAAGELARVAALARDRGERVVFTNGCFDVLHAGHVASLNQAKRLGDVLVVALNDDASVTRLKGAGRPVNPLADRAAVVGALSCVDHVTSFAADTPADLLRTVRPEIYVKGGDYTPDMLSETDVVREWNGRVETVGYLADRSSSATLGRADAAGLAVHR